MLSKNKLSEPDEDKNTPKDENNTATKTKTKDKDEDIDRDRNKFIQMFQLAKLWRRKKGNWKRKQIIWIFWDDDHMSELCEKWIYHNHNYAYTRFEELRTRSGEVLFTRENKATKSKDESDTYIDIDELPMFKDFTTKGKTKPKTKTKTKTENKDLLDKTEDTDKDNTEDIDKDKTGTKDKDKDKDKTSTKNKTSTKDKGNTASKTKTWTRNINKKEIIQIFEFSTLWCKKKKKILVLKILIG